MLGLEYFSFEDVWSPLMIVCSLAVLALYSFVVGPWRGRFAGSAAVPLGRQLAFFCGIFLLYLAQAGPLSLLGHLMFTFHMTNMALSYMVVPPLLLYGVPAWLWRGLFGRAFWRPLRPLMNPLVCLFLFVLLFSFYHMPDIHDWIMVHTTFHAFFYVVLFISAMMMWWHMLPPVPEWTRISALMRLGYVFLTGLLLTPACVMIIFAGTPLFAVYNDPQTWVRAMDYCMAGDPAALLAQFEGPAFFNLMKPEDDQQLGGIIMKLVQEFINVLALYAIFMQWYRKERKRDEDEETAAQEGLSAVRLNNG